MLYGSSWFTVCFWFLKTSQWLWCGEMWARGLSCQQLSSNYSQSPHSPSSSTLLHQSPDQHWPLIGQHSLVLSSDSSVAGVSCDQWISEAWHTAEHCLVRAGGDSGAGTHTHLSYLYSLTTSLHLQVNHHSHVCHPLLTYCFFIFDPPEYFCRCF